MGHYDWPTSIGYEHVETISEFLKTRSTIGTHQGNQNKLVVTPFHPVLPFLEFLGADSKENPPASSESILDRDPKIVAKEGKATERDRDNKKTNPRKTRGERSLRKSLQSMQIQTARTEETAIDH